jgi:hypothetical protein
MKGISAIIVTVMILMIAISLTGLGYVTFTTFFSKITTSAEGAISQTLTTMLAQMKIESIVKSNVIRVYVRNTGKVDLTNFSAYINDAYNQVQSGTPTGGKIVPGNVSEVNITNTSIVNTGDIIKLTTAQGIIAMQAAP